MAQRSDPNLLDRALKVFSDVRAGESTTLLLMLANLFLMLVAYYVLKTVREPLILATGGAELKSYAAAAQAGVLIVLVPLYSRLAKRVSRVRLLAGVTLFFIVCLQAFYAGSLAELPYLGFVFYVWVGIFSVAVIAQFWSYANDIYAKPDGERLFPVIAIGAPVGSTAGSYLAGQLFDVGLAPSTLMQVAAGILGGSLLLYVAIERSATKDGQADAQDEAPASAGGGFAMVWNNTYIRWIALLLILLNVVNTTGEYVLGSMVEDAAKQAAAADPSVDIKSYIGSFYGDFFFYVNIGTMLLQAFVVGRMVQWFGIRGAALALPIVSLSAYGLAATGVGLAVFQWAKSAENMTDYSFMNTAKAMLWLPTTREEKYAAKQAVDTFFVRLGDVISAGFVFVGTTWLALDLQGFIYVNLAVALVWLAVTLRVVNLYRALSSDAPAEA